ncbi:hypothetical protein ACQX4F_11950, partial [Corynebacterium diphtheriae]
PLRRTHQPRATATAHPVVSNFCTLSLHFRQDGPSRETSLRCKMLTAATNPAPRFSIHAKILF